MTKKTKSFLFTAAVSVLTLLIIWNIFLIFSKNTAKDNDDTLNYVALGDSITYGYNLPKSEKNFPTLLSENLNAELTNYGIVGLTSEELLSNLKNNKYDLKNADIITLDIGSNDLLHPFTQIVAEEMGIDTSKNVIEELIVTFGKNPASLIAKLPALQSSLENNVIFDNAVEKFKTSTFPDIISEIKKRNPDAEIILINLYNPYYGVGIPLVFDLSSICDKYISEMNETFLNPSDYKVADVYDYFQEDGMTNVEFSLSDLPKISVDPHPNAQGHRVIYSLVNQILENSKYNQNY
jgi:lysophospholipase L1-like esterase